MRLRSNCVVAPLCLMLSACSITKIGADSAASVMVAGAPRMRAYFDYDSAGLGAASAMMQLEALHGVSPGNDGLTLMTAQAYVAYAFGWVMDAQERAQFEAEFEEADRQRHRAHLMYSRARDLVLSIMRERDPGIDAALKKDPATLKRYLHEHYDDPEEDIEPVFWIAISWGSAMFNAGSLDALIDMPSVKTLAEHAVYLNEGYENGGALGLLGGFESAYPEALGGNLQKGRDYFDRAMKHSKRRDHVLHLNYARTYAINAQDKALFLSLLREVVQAGDLGDNVRMSNKVARRRAELYLAHTHEFFD